MHKLSQFCYITTWMKNVYSNSIKNVIFIFYLKRIQQKYTAENAWRMKMLFIIKICWFSITRVHSYDFNSQIFKLNNSSTLNKVKVISRYFHYIIQSARLFRVIRVLDNMGKIYFCAQSRLYDVMQITAYDFHLIQCTWIIQLKYLRIEIMSMNSRYWEPANFDN